jgi:hypothetical protein
MLDKLTGALAHVIGLALVCAIAAYWLIRIATPAPSVAPAAMSPPPPRDPDPVLAARMFGKVQTNDAAPSNLQLVGVFAAGRQSAAAISVDGRPARVFLLDQSVTNDLKLHAVDGDGVQLTNAAGAVQTVRVPRQAVAHFSTEKPANVYSFDRGMMTAPSVEGPATTAPTGGTSRRGQIPRDAQEIQPQVNVGAPPPQPSPVQQLTPPQPPPPQPAP